MSFRLTLKKKKRKKNSALRLLTLPEERGFRVSTRQEKIATKNAVVPEFLEKGVHALFSKVWRH